MFALTVGLVRETLAWEYYMKRLLKLMYIVLFRSFARPAAIRNGMGPSSEGNPTALRGDGSGVEAKCRFA